MLENCIEVFEAYKEKDPSIVLNTYLPADGTYVILQKSPSGYKVREQVTLKYNKKTGELEGCADENLLHTLCLYDYNSKLVSIQKPIDQKKTIHSNNYLSFWVKKDSLDGKLTANLIAGYYNVLADPANTKYRGKGTTLNMYQAVESELGAPNVAELEEIQNWVMENIYTLSDLGVNTGGKDYLKLFFELSSNAAENEENFERENKRYLVPNIYNSNKYTVALDGETLGVPDNNLGLNDKKPYLMNKTRGVETPYLINTEQVIKQKEFFDYLYNLACMGRVNVYVDCIHNEIYSYPASETPTEAIQGYYLRVQKGKELEIHDFSVLSGDIVGLDKPFKVYNIIGVDLSKDIYAKHDYEEKTTKVELENLLNEQLYSKYLKTNYFTNSSDLRFNDTALKRCLLDSRSKVFNYIYKDIDNGFYKAVSNVAHNLIYTNLSQGYEIKATYLFNMYYSLLNMVDKKEECYKMAQELQEMRDALRVKINARETGCIESDNEYYFGIGQVVSYLVWLNNSNNKKQDLLNPFIKVSTDKMLRAKLNQLYRGYNFAINNNNLRFNNLFSMLKLYTPTTKVNHDMIIAGYLHDSLILEKKNKDEDK